MGSIIRSPDISEQKRKLGSRQAKPSEPQGIQAAQGSPGAQGTWPPESEPDSKPQVERLLEQARAAMRAEWEKETEAVREQARQSGWSEGRAAGAEEAARSAAAAVAQLQAITAKLAAALESGVRGIEDMAVAIAYEAACKLLGDVAHGRDGIQALVRQAAAQAIHAERVVVRLGTRDLATLREAAALDAVLPSGLPVTWVADDTILHGGCLVETDGGELDARLETQFERLRAALVAARNGGN